jgi:hypothetical protein
MADDTSPSSPTGHITIPTTKNNNNTHGQDPQAMTPNAKRRLGLFPRSNSQKLLQKPTQRRWHTNRNTNTSNSKLAEQQQHQEEDEEGQATDDFPFDPTRLVVRLSLSGARHLASSDVSRGREGAKGRNVQIIYRRCFLFTLGYRSEPICDSQLCRTKGKDTCDQANL